MKITLKQARTTFNMCQQLSNGALKDPKSRYAADKNKKALEEKVEKLNSRLFEVKLDHALCDEKTKGVIRDDKDNFQFTAEGTKEVEKKGKKILDETIDFEPYLFPDNEEVQKMQSAFFTMDLEFLLPQSMIDAYYGIEPPAKANKKK